MIGIDTALKPSEDVLFGDLGGEAVLLDLATGRYFGLDGVATRIWQLIAERASLDAVREAMLAEYDVSDPVLSTDLLEFAGELVRRGLLTQRS